MAQKRTLHLNLRSEQENMVDEKGEVQTERSLSLKDCKKFKQNSKWTTRGGSRFVHMSKSASFDSKRKGAKE